MTATALLSKTAALLVGSLGVALLGNALHPKGIVLERDYFPVSQNTLEHEYLTISTEDAHDYWEYLVDEPGGVYFIDARRQKSFASGHIEGAHNIDRYQDLDGVSDDLIEKLKNAGIVIVYCNGGECEDSIFLANDLVYRWQVPAEVIAVYEGGISAWLEAEFSLTAAEEN